MKATEQNSLKAEGLTGILRNGVGRGKFLFQPPHLFEQLIGPLGLLLVDFTDSKTYVHQDVVAHGGFRHEIKTALANGTSELHARRACKAQVLAS
jgi:hypothetical protein